MDSKVQREQQGRRRNGATAKAQEDIFWAANPGGKALVLSIVGGESEAEATLLHVRRLLTSYEGNGLNDRMILRNTMSIILSLDCATLCLQLLGGSLGIDPVPSGSK